LPENKTTTVRKFKNRAVSFLYKNTRNVQPNTPLKTTKQQINLKLCFFEFFGEFFCNFAPSKKKKRTTE